jgi:hypothetical protein
VQTFWFGVGPAHVAGAPHVKICRHFRLPHQIIRGCAVGRIAFFDCGLGCRSYNPDPDPQSRNFDELLAWEGAEATLSNIDAMDDD